MFYELLKIRKQVFIKVLILFFSLIAALDLFMALRTFSYTESADGMIIKGTKAISPRQEQFNLIQGEVTTEKLNKALKYYQSIKDPDRAYLKTDIKYPGLSQLLDNAYNSGDGSSDNLYSIKNANDFYSRNVQLLEKKLELSNKEITSESKEEVLKRAKEIPQPYRLSFYEQWKNFFKTMMVLGILLSIAAILIGSRLFSSEIERSMDALLLVNKDKTLLKIGRDKLLAMFYLLSALYFGATLLIGVIYFSITGLEGASNPIQLEFFTSLYPITFGHALLLVIFVEWICIITIGAITAFVNAISLRSFFTIIVAGLITLVPIIANNFTFLPNIILNTFRTQPVSGVMIIQNFNDYNIYSLFGAPVLGITKILVISVIILIVLYLMTPSLFAKNLRKSEG